MSEIDTYLQSQEYRAWQQAQSLWGRFAFANHTLHPGTYYVGVTSNKNMPESGWEIYGHGDSWEAAFRAAGHEVKL